MNASLTSFNSIFTSDLIAIIVGPHKERLTAHKAILTQAKYFQGCLQGNFPEKEKNEIVVPEDDPRAFEKLLEYLYFGSIEAEHFPATVRDEPERAHMTLLAKAYVAADKYCMEDCQSHVMDHFWDFHGQELQRLPCLQAITELGALPENPLRNFLFAKLATALCGKGADPRARLVRDKGIREMMRKGGDDAEDLFMACLDLMVIRNAGVEVPQGTRCDFHVHKVTRKCGFPEIVEEERISMSMGTPS